MSKVIYTEFPDYKLVVDLSWAAVRSDKLYKPRKDRHIIADDNLLEGE